MHGLNRNVQTQNNSGVEHCSFVGGGIDSFEGRDCHRVLLAHPTTQCHIPEQNPRLGSPSSTERT
jgi:hypothetical protein